MLFTVNVESLTPPQSILLEKITVGYGVKTSKMHLTAEKLQQVLPQESETGLQVLPGKIELDMLIKLFDRCINWVKVKRVVTMGYRNFQWPGHVTVDKQIYLKYTIVRVKQRLMCTDVEWLCEVLDQDDHKACHITIRQRIYPA